MKKIILVAAVGMLALVSCKKNYTCDCTSITDIDYKLNKADAETTKKACETIPTCKWVTK